jgi:maleate isomerase
LSAALQGIVDELLAATGASRATLRLDSPPEYFPVVAEACAPGVRSLRGDTSVDLRNAPTFTAIRDELRIILQDDCLNSVPPTPPEVIDLYGVRAQMLAPVPAGGRLLGTMSVHEASGPRHWSEADRQALESAVAAVLREVT